MADSPADREPTPGEIRAAMARTRADLAAKVGELQRRILGGARPRTTRGETPMPVKTKAKTAAGKRGGAKAKAAPAARRKTAGAKAKRKGGAKTAGKKAAVKARGGAAKSTAKRAAKTL